MIPEKFTNSVIDPFEKKVITPVVRVRVTNTPLTVKSLGLEQTGYLLNDSSVPEFETLSNLTKQYSGISPLVGFFSFTKSPIGILSQQNFALKFTGSFFPIDYTTTDNFTFKTIGYGKLRARLGATDIFGSAPNTFISLDPRTYVESNTVSLSSATTMVVEYYTIGELGSSGFCLLWKSDTDPDYQIVSAGVTFPEINPNDAAALITQTLNFVTDVSFSNSNNEISNASFNIPIAKSTDILNGYSYNRDLDKYEDVTDKFNKFLKKNMLVEIEIGYKEDDGSSKFIKKFVGHIKSFNIDRENRNADTIKVECGGFGSLLKESLNFNYPNFFDYWAAEYAGIEFNDQRPDGIRFPQTFDNWELDKVVKSLLIRGNIDPHLFNKNQLFLNNAEVQVSGSNLIENPAPPVVLERARNYGSSAKIFLFEAADDEYRLKSNFGDTIFDYVNKVTEPYGWEWGFHPFYDSAPYLRARNNPTSIVASEDPNITFSDFWGNKSANLDVISGTYREATTATVYVEHSFTGQRIDLVNILYSSSGGVQATVASGISLTQFTIMNEVGGSFAAGHRIIADLPDKRDSSTINSVSSSTITLDGSLRSIPVSGTIIRTAIAEAEIRRGGTWATAIPVVTGTYIPSYYEHGLEKFIPAQRVSPLGGDPIITGTKRMFYHGRDRDTIDNPTLFNLGTGLTRDEHTVRLTRLPNAESIAGTILGFNAFLIYDKDRNLPVYTFRTDDTLASGTVLKLDVDNNSEDMRNDVIVVGRRLGVEVPGGFESKPVNPNNPTGKFIVSRGTDISSIFDKNALNFTGRPSQTILIEPSIGSQDRADYWAVQFLNRFRFPGNEAKFESLGHPLMEIGDCIYVNDANKSSIDTSNRLWIEDINTRWGQKEAFDTFETTTFPPWESFTPKVPVSISDFEDKPILDIQITNGGTAASPYDPYDADANGTFIEITFDLVVSGFLRVSIISHNGILIAHLLNPNGDEGRKGWVRETFGKNKKVIWDGVDLEGVWNEQKLSVTDSKNWFVGEDSQLGFGKFYVEFESIDFAGVTRLIKTIDTDTFIFTNRGAQIDSTFTLTPAFSDGVPTSTTTFKNTDNANRGLKLDIRDVTGAGFRPSQLRVQVIPWVWGAYREFNSDSSTEVRAPIIHVPGIPYDGDFLSEIEISNNTFIKYDANLGSVFFQPKDRGFSFSDWEGLFKQVKPSKLTTSNIQLFYIGWYFGFVMELTDKSGRTDTLYKKQLWTGTGGLVGSFTPLNAQFYGTVFSDERRSIGGNPNLKIGVAPAKPLLFSTLVERNA